jgi:hypothetical protein
MQKPPDYRASRNASTQARSDDGWRPHSQGVLLLAFILLPFGGALAYAGNAWAAVCYHLFADGGMLVLWLAAALGLGLLVLRAIKTSERQMPAALHFSTAAALGLGIESLIVLGLGLAGWLNVASAWALLVIGGAAGVFCIWSGERAAEPDSLWLWLKAPAGREWTWLLATPFLAIVLVGAMAPPGMLWSPGEPHGYDVVEYHLQIPREWFEAGRIVPLEHNVFSYFPFNVEMHFLLAMHLRQGPWAAMYLAQLMHAAFMGLTVVAVYGFAVRLCQSAAAPSDDSTAGHLEHFSGCNGVGSSKSVAAEAATPARPGYTNVKPAPAPSTQHSSLLAIIAALSLLTVPWLTQIACIAYDEGGFLLFGVLAIGWSFSATFEAKNRLRRFALAGVMAGFAAGSKLTGVPEVLVAVPVASGAAALWFMLSRRNSVEKRGQWRGIAVFCLAGLLSFSPWLLRNMAWAGNPVFPELMPVLGHGHFNAAQVDRWEKAHKPPVEQQSPRARLVALRDQVALGWQFGYLLLPLGLIAFVLSIRRPQAWFLFGLLLILTVFWLGFTHLQARFFLLAAPICALLIAQVDWRFSGISRSALNSREQLRASDLVGSAPRTVPTAAQGTVGSADPTRFSRGASIAISLLVGLAITVAWWKTHNELLDRLYGPAGKKAAVLGIDNLNWLSLDHLVPEGVPDNVTLVLVGEARAFWYAGLPMSRLKYRTVFDVKGEGHDFVTAWAGPVANRPLTWRLIDPAELIRLSRTYRDLPEVPEGILKDGAPYVEKP